MQRKLKKIDKINVLITGVGGISFGSQILKALRLSDLPYHLIGTDTNPWGLGMSSVHKRYIVPPTQDPNYLDVLMEICQKDSVRVIFPGSESELKLLSRHHLKFKKLGIFLPVPPLKQIELLTNKLKTMKFLASKNILIPQTSLIKSSNDIKKIDYYPVVCKPHINSGGSQNVFIAQDPNEMRLLCEYLLKYLNQFLVQEYIGTPDSEYSIGVLLDMEGRVIDSIGLKRYLSPALSRRIKVNNTTGREELGKSLVISSGISQGEIGRFPEITKYCEKTALQIRARGPINFQCRVFEQKVYIFEINPRFSGTTSLRAMVGFNEPDILIRKYLLGVETKSVHYKEGLILRDIREKLLKKPYGHEIPL